MYLFITCMSSDWRKAMLYTTLSGLAEPLGAAAAVAALAPLLTPWRVHVSLVLVAGFMMCVR
jgi:zinc transporter ZupT